MIYNYLETKNTDNNDLQLYNFLDEQGNIIGVIMPINTDIESAKNQLIEYLNNSEESPLGLS